VSCQPAALPINRLPLAGPWVARRSQHRSRTAVAGRRRAGRRARPKPREGRRGVPQGRHDHGCRRGRATVAQRLDGRVAAVACLGGGRERGGAPLGGGLRRGGLCCGRLRGCVPAAAQAPAHGGRGRGGHQRAAGAAAVWPAAEPSSLGGSGGAGDALGGRTTGRLGRPSRCAVRVVRRKGACGTSPSSPKCIRRRVA
jgi:hypothetical protein